MSSAPPQPLRMANGTTIKKRLKELHITQDNAAKEIGIGRPALNQILNGHFIPSGETLAKLGQIVQGALQIGSQVVSVWDRDSTKKPAAGEPFQYSLREDRPIELQVDGGTILVEVSRKPMTSEVELRVRLPQTKTG